jgi:hypothetical protein
MKEYSVDYLNFAHTGSSCHKAEILNENLCGCFYCKAIFSPSAIKEWIEENDNGCQAAICPECDIDSVLSSKWPINDPLFLEAMQSRWFGK